MRLTPGQREAVPTWPRASSDGRRGPGSASSANPIRLATGPVPPKRSFPAAAPSEQHAQPPGLDPPDHAPPNSPPPPFVIPMFEIIVDVSIVTLVFGKVITLPS